MTDIDKFLNAARRIAIMKLASAYPDSVLAGVYSLDEVSITFAFDPHTKIEVMPHEVEAELSKTGP